MRPKNLDEVVGQQHLIAPNKPLRQTFEQGKVHSMIFWGPPGTGKTTLARLLAQTANAEFTALSAVLAGVKEIRQSVERAKARKAAGLGISLLFVDEVHRFNKAQQDAFLPHIEDGTIVFIGATTENPSFELNNALFSRVRVYVLKPLLNSDVQRLIERAVNDQQNGLGQSKVKIEADAIELLAHKADGDARRALTLLEIASDLQDQNSTTLDIAAIDAISTGPGTRRFDKAGDVFYDQISALHKSVRGSDPDASLYWVCRMLDGGVDPKYLARRLVRIASEDIGNADPRALHLCLDAWQVQERLGSPEGELALAQAVTYLAIAAKSNAVYTAFQSAMQLAKQSGSLDVPRHLRNAPTKLSKDLGHGKDYRYAHNEDGAFAAGEQYLPAALKGQRFYRPVERGLEIKIKEKMDRLRAQNQDASVIKNNKSS